MRYTTPILAALAATATATAPMERATKMFTLETAPGETIEVTEEEKFQLMDQGKHFFDITEFKDAEISALRLLEDDSRPFPNKLHQRCTVEKLHAKIDLDTIKTQLEEFTTFHNRYYQSQYGVAAAEWLYERVREVIQASGNPLATVRLVRHVAWAQPSIVATIPGSDRDRIVVVGAHLDSVISGDRGAGRAPGAGTFLLRFFPFLLYWFLFLFFFYFYFFFAFFVLSLLPLRVTCHSHHLPDDDGSGSLMILDALRVLLTDPRIADGDLLNTIEFHWYGAEEAGLLGSQDIFTQYRGLNRQVVAMLNQDMVGYKGRDGIERFGLVTDWTSPSQNEYMKLLIGEYTDIPYEESRCGYACSDHASANRNGYRSSFVFETPFGNHNPLIHTPNDTMDTVDFDHVYQHAKLTTGYLYELGYWPFAPETSL
ncbi:bacterial leucyl aminopeptidase [Sodiomyces alkalinus F11]|uniref:Peptide hydrolase n=1 Tax=Sodiomyces alkalinus (strain CBS 110278 / VKM F-3762 / F11) TaxID=1314773 RepID=A0A3N2PU95_SODAK|nr:bacterial leucyl aminopeptidase [Sodiomyces alkalinus F11]ROT38051.1 bacterial leucyl aminopeptidase [Sodiomyces alkalinus F11]